MSVYRELAAELRANKAVIDSLNSRNQQLLQQNQFLKQEIHNVVQSALSLGQAAGVARPAPHLVGQNAEPIDSNPYSTPNGFPNAIAPDSLARLAHLETGAAPMARSYERSGEPTYQPPVPATAHSPKARRAEPMPRVPQPITPATQKSTPKTGSKEPNPKGASQKSAKPKADKSVARQKAVALKQQSTQTVGRRTEAIAVKQPSPPKPKLFTEQSGSFRSSALDVQEDKEISGIWLVLSIILIVVTAFGAGFLIMKPLLNDR